MISDIFRKTHRNNFYVLTGDFLEFFDLYMYVHLAHIIHKHYFVGVNASLLNIFTFANLYFLAPIGCIIFAYLGDTVGRKKIIVSTSIVMAFCSTAIGLLPTYQDIGALAGVLLIALRILQGISLSGEPTAALLYLIESTPYRYAPLMVALDSATTCLGGMTALGVGYIAIDLWGEQAWRVPFYLGVFFCFFSIWLRWNLSESKEYLEYTSYNQELLVQKKKMTILEFYQSLHFRNRNFFCLMGMSCCYGTAFSISYIYLGNYLTSWLGVTEHGLLAHNFYVTLCEMLICLCEGFVVVKFNLPIRRYILFKTTLFLFCVLPAMVYVLNTAPSIAAVFLTQVALVSFSDTTVICTSVIKTFQIIGRFSLMGIASSCSKFLIFFNTGIVVNFVSASYSVVWTVAIMFIMSALFFAAVFFYTPFHKLPAFALEHPPSLPEEKPEQEAAA